MPPRSANRRLSDQEAKEMYEKMMSGETVDFNAVFDPVAARKKKVIEEQAKINRIQRTTKPGQGKPPPAPKPKFSTKSEGEPKRASSGNKLKDMPKLMKQLKGRDFTAKVEATKEVAFITDYTTVDEDELLCKNGFMGLMIDGAFTASGELKDAALEAILHLTSGKIGVTQVGEHPDFVKDLATQAAEGDARAKEIVNHLCASRANRDLIMDIPGGKGVHLIKSIVDEKKPRYVKKCDRK